MFSFGRADRVNGRLASELWQDRELLIDSKASRLALRVGERIVESLEDVEDAQSNTGERGRLMLTTLRFVWASASSPRCSLSIGLGLVQSASVRSTDSRARGASQALVLQTIYRGTRYQFIFASVSREAPRALAVASRILRG